MEEALRELAKAKEEIARLQKIRDDLAKETKKAQQEYLKTKQDSSQKAPDYDSKEYWSKRYSSLAPQDDSKDISSFVPKSHIVKDSGADSSARASAGIGIAENTIASKESHQDEVYEWYVSYSSIAAMVEAALARVDPKHADHIFIPGVGNSTIAEELAIKYPNKSILANDFDEKVVDHMQARARTKNLPNLRYIAGDLTRMISVASGSQGLVLDKGTLDAIAGGETKGSGVLPYLREMWRVLGVSGQLVLVTCLPPHILQALALTPLFARSTSTACACASPEECDCGQGGAWRGLCDWQQGHIFTALRNHDGKDGEVFFYAITKRSAGLDPVVSSQSSKAGGVEGGVDVRNGIQALLSLAKELGEDLRLGEEDGVWRESPDPQGAQGDSGHGDGNGGWQQWREEVISYDQYLREYPDLPLSKPQLVLAVQSQSPTPLLPGCPVTIHLHTPPDTHQAPPHHITDDDEIRLVCAPSMYAESELCMYECVEYVEGRASVPVTLPLYGGVYDVVYVHPLPVQSKFVKRYVELSRLSGVIVPCPIYLADPDRRSSSDVQHNVHIQRMCDSTRSDTQTHPILIPGRRRAIAKQTPRQIPLHVQYVHAEVLHSVRRVKLDIQFAGPSSEAGVVCAGAVNRLLVWNPHYKHGNSRTIRTKERTNSLTLLVEVDYAHTDELHGRAQVETVCVSVSVQGLGEDMECDWEQAKAEVYMGGISVRIPFASLTPAGMRDIQGEILLDAGIMDMLKAASTKHEMDTATREDDDLRLSEVLCGFCAYPLLQSSAPLAPRPLPSSLWDACMHDCVCSEDMQSSGSHTRLFSVSELSPQTQVTGSQALETWVSPVFLWSGVAYKDEGEGKDACAWGGVYGCEYASGAVCQMYTPMGGVLMATPLAWNSSSKGKNRSATKRIETGIRCSGRGRVWENAVSSLSSLASCAIRCKRCEYYLGEGTYAYTAKDEDEEFAQLSEVQLLWHRIALVHANTPTRSYLHNPSPTLSLETWLARLLQVACCKFQAPLCVLFPHHPQAGISINDRNDINSSNSGSNSGNGMAMLLVQVLSPKQLCGRWTASTYSSTCAIASSTKSSDTIVVELKHAVKIRYYRENNQDHGQKSKKDGIKGALGQMGGKEVRLPLSLEDFLLVLELLSRKDAEDDVILGDDGWKTALLFL
eukprot:gene30794-37204_t